MTDDGADNTRVERILEQILESGDTPEEACRACPELLPGVRAGLRQLRELEQEVSALFPPSNPGDTQPTGPLVGDQLPNVPGYEVQGILGHGGMGIVYCARHLRLNRPVALKMILAGAYALPNQRQRFLREAEAIAAVAHPNIVQVYNAGETDGQAWFTMELVEGGGLAQRIKGKPQPIGPSAGMVADIAAGMAVAHRHGIIHRDLKPSNILLTVDGTPKVTDFGLARWPDEDAITLTGSPLGTASYMSPEQARGALREIGPATDVYALGAMLYELLTGRPPFRGETSSATIQQVLTDQVVPPRRLNPRVPRDLETICLKCLDKEPGRRYPSAQELSDDLLRYLKDEPIHARRVGAVGRCIRWGRRRPAHAALLVGSLLVAGVLVFGGQQMHALRQARARSVETDLADARQLAGATDWTGAALALARAEGRLGKGGPKDLLRRIDETRGEIDRARLRAEFVRRVERIRLARATRVEARFDPEAERRFRNERADSEYAGALVATGFGAAGEDPAAVGSRVIAGGAASEVVLALDDWRLCAVERRRRDWLADVLRRIDPDPWRNHVRDPAVWENEPAVRTVAQGAPIAGQRVDFLITLAERLGQVSSDGVALIKRVQQAHGSDFWADFTAGNLLLADDPKEAVEYLRRAVALRPNSACAMNNLALAKATAGSNDAFQTFEDALRTNPKYAPTLNNMGVIWKKSGNYEKAAAYLRNAVACDPDLPEPRCILAEIAMQSDWPGVVELLRRAVAIDPKFARAHYLLGLALSTGAPGDEAHAISDGRDVRKWGLLNNGPVAYYSAASQFDPDWFPVTQDRARLGEAIAQYRMAVTYDPSLARASGSLGQALLNHGEFEAALRATRRAIDLAGQEHPHEDGLTDRERTGLTFQLQRCQRAIELDARLPSIHDAATRPADPQELLELAEICVAKGRNAAAAAFYLRAFEAAPELVADPKSGHRYRAACAAALAEADALDDPGPGWRRQSREWLRAEFAQDSEQLKSANPADAIRVYFRLSHWLTDPALASVRDDAALAGISPREAEECRRLWADVSALRDRAEKVVDGGTVPAGQ